MTQKKRILIAGTITGLLLMTLMAFSFSKTTALLNQADTQATNTIQITQPVDGAAATDVQALQDYNSNLESALQTMQAREAQYQQQLEAANRTITEMQQPAQPSLVVRAGEHFEHEHEGFEHDDD